MFFVYYILIDARSQFGLRRAQGPDGGFSASKYCIIGGFDGTSNVIAGKLLGEDVKVKGTHAHAFVQSFKGLEEVVFEEGTGGEKIKKSTLKYRREVRRFTHRPSFEFCDPSQPFF